MISKFIIDTIRNLADKFDFGKLQTKFAPFVHVVYVTAENTYTDVSVSLFFQPTGKTIWSEHRGQVLAKTAHERSYVSISQIPFTSIRSSVADSTGKTTTLRLKAGEYLVVTVLTSVEHDQNLITNAIIKELTQK